MKNKFFDNYEFEKIINIAKINPYEAKIIYEKYKEKYPNDYSALLFYASLLITLRKLTEAEKIINRVSILLNRDGNFKSNHEKYLKSNDNFIFCKIKLLMYQEKYAEAYDICIKGFKIKNINIIRVRKFLENRLGIYNNVKKGDSYLYRQISNYNEEDFINHIEKHESDYNLEKDNRNENIFSYELDIRKIINEIKKYIPSDKGLYEGLFEDSYYFKYDECGREKNKLVNYIKVVCFHNTDNFITIVPVSQGEYFPYIDLNYMKEKEENNKVKKVSQIEKFYHRYHNLLIKKSSATFE